ncbi:bifunctional adenosylcobinamide kinase/adenosylcobinamide-phosphate guanylyltransferase [Corynebacterium sp. H78]|uniref:bifunctional adenosylcobinamide kinase/adenosylcobinamide-phosphate guanylyltransferase n=1 Tax=Corynebacterium sp. H78 TaxID=3133417 RepID=UPI0030A29DCF
MRILVLGGARSGKSAWAESFFAHDSSRAEGLTDSPVVNYVATARPWPGDDDFGARIAAHQLRRPAHWPTIDDTDAVDILRTPESLAAPGHVLLDDVGTWLTHLIDQHDAWEKPRGHLAHYTEELVNAVAGWPSQSTEQHLVIVSPEVGMSVIPEHRSGRLFRDEIGSLNSQLAEVCDKVVLVVAGCELVMKQP